MSVPQSSSPTTEPRVPPGGFRELGPLNWVISRFAARAIRRPEMHLFSVLGRRRMLFLTWLPFSGTLLGLGKLARADSELVILRVGQLRNCDYELQQHSRLAKRYGVDSALQAKIFEGPKAEGLTEWQRLLLTATDEFIVTRTLSDAMWAALSGHLDRAQLIEFCTLAAQYDALAATINTLQIPMDVPD